MFPLLQECTNGTWLLFIARVGTIQYLSTLFALGMRSQMRFAVLQTVGCSDGAEETGAAWVGAIVEEGLRYSGSDL